MLIATGIANQRQGIEGESHKDHRTDLDIVVNYGYDIRLGKPSVLRANLHVQGY